MGDTSLRSGQVLIVGLGNPGSRYSTTRHNLGRMLVLDYAKQHDLTFKKSDPLHGNIATGWIGQCKVFFLSPTTYMNHSGLAVKKCVDYFKIPLENLLVIADDIHIPFGKLRLREKGGDGGHNGLKSVQQHLQAQEYARLRMGIGNKFIGSLEEHVLSDFNKNELEQLSHINHEGRLVLDIWIRGDIRLANEAASKAQLPAVQGENE